MQSSATTDLNTARPDTTSSVNRSLGLNWLISMVLAATLGLAALHFLPWQFTIPQAKLDELQGNTMGLSALEAEMAPALRWKNDLLRLTLVGISFGVLPMLLVGRSAIVVRLMIGLVAGAVCGAGCMWLVETLSAFVSNTSWGQTADGSPAMGAEILFYAVGSLLILFPVAIAIRMSGVDGAGQKAIAMPVAGILVGLLLPIVATFAFPETGLGKFPPESIAASVVWLALLAGLGVLLPMVTGDQKRGNAKLADGQAAD